MLRNLEVEHAVDYVSLLFLLEQLPWALYELEEWLNLHFDLIQQLEHMIEEFNSFSDDESESHLELGSSEWEQRTPTVSLWVSLFIFKHVQSQVSKSNCIQKLADADFIIGIQLQCLQAGELLIPELQDVSIRLDWLDEELKVEYEVSKIAFDLLFVFLKSRTYIQHLFHVD